jgi:hypothetical protein
MVVATFALSSSSQAARNGIPTATRCGKLIERLPRSVLDRHGASQIPDPIILTSVLIISPLFRNDDGFDLGFEIGRRDQRLPQIQFHSRVPTAAGSLD